MKRIGIISGIFVAISVWPHQRCLRVHNDKGRFQQLQAIQLHQPHLTG